MGNIVLATFAALALTTASVAADAPTEASPTEQLLNEPSANWNVYGPGQTHKGRKDKDVQGGGAIRVIILNKPANPWDVGASTEIKGAIKKGDRLLLAFWGRLVSGGVDGKTEIPAIVQRNSTPYEPIVSGRVELNGEWKLVHIEGTANADFAAGAANAALSIGTQAQTIDLGPAFIMAVR